MARMRAWYSEKRAPGSDYRRFWDLGADLDKNGALRILRMPSGASAEGNKGLVIHIADDVKNPIGLDIINEGSGSAITVRTTADGSVTGGLDADGNALLGSAKAIKKNLKAIADSTADKYLGMLIQSWSYKEGTSGARHVGPTAEDFADATGYGDGKTIHLGTFVGVAFRALQRVAARVEELESRLGTSESDEKAVAKEALKEADDIPSV